MRRLWSVSGIIVAALSAAALAGSGTSAAPQAPEPRTIRGLYVTGGGFHEFAEQERIVPPAVAERVRIDWTIDHTAGTSHHIQHIRPVRRVADGQGLGDGVRLHRCHKIQTGAVRLSYR